MTGASELESRSRPASAGVLASVAASVLFGVVFLIPPLIPSLDATAITSWRVAITLPVVSLMFLSRPFRRDARSLAARLRARPSLALVVLLDAALLGIQLWLFAWAPQSGHGLDASLGYLLLPLVMVAVGLAHREQLPPLRLSAVVAAGLGVGCALLIAGGLSWATVVIALGYPLYFVLRSRARLNTLAAFWCEIVALTPVALAVMLAPPARAELAERPSMLWGLLALGVLGGVAFLCYLTASRLLSFGVFGLLTYLEPILLVVVSIGLLRERFHPLDALVYGPIALALVLLAVESTRRSSARPTMSTSDVPAVQEVAQ